MKRQRVKLFLYQAWGIVLVLALFWLWHVAPVRADVGPVPVVPPGSNLKPEGATQIQMVAETIVLNIRAVTADDQLVLQLAPSSAAWNQEWLPAVADVSADFAMLNPGNEAVNLTVWFPLSSDLTGEPVWAAVGRFQATAGGKVLPVTVVELPNPNGQDQPSLPWASFPVTFPASQALLIRVTYTLPPQLAPGDNIGMYFSYVFQTGAGWAGAIGQAELIVNLPYPVGQETVGSAPAGGQAAGRPPVSQLRWSWQNLEPGKQDDFSIHLLQPQHWNAIARQRTNVQLAQEDGNAWIELAKIYRSLTHSKGPGLARDFGPVFQSLGVQACLNASRLLPAHPMPHAGLAELYLAPLFSAGDASAQDLELIQEELRLAEQLLVSQASEEASRAVEQVRNSLEIFQDHLATATAQAAYTPTSPTSSTPGLSDIPPPPPSATLQFFPASTTAPSSTSRLTSGGWQNSPLLLVAGIMILLAGGVLLLSWILQRRR